MTWSDDQIRAALMSARQIQLRAKEARRMARRLEVEYQEAIEAIHMMLHWNAPQQPPPRAPPRKPSRLRLTDGPDSDQL
jgi:hypothetical protein